MRAANKFLILLISLLPPVRLYLAQNCSGLVSALGEESGEGDEEQEEVEREEVLEDTEDTRLLPSSRSVDQGVE